MPETFLTNHAPDFLKVYDEFYKQTQYKMTAFEKCEDPNNQDLFGFNVTYPTDTYYPKGNFSLKLWYFDYFLIVKFSSYQLLIITSIQGPCVENLFISLPASILEILAHH